MHRAQQRPVFDVERRLHARRVLGDRAGVRGGGHARDVDALERDRRGFSVALRPYAGFVRVAQSQRIVMREHGGERLLERGRVEIRGDVEQERLVPVVRLFEVLLEEPVLDRRQRHDAGRGLFRRRAHGRSRGDDLGELRDRRMLEEIARRQAQAALVAARDDLDAEDRIAAELEEMIVDADALDAQHVLPDVGERGFGRVARRDERFGADCARGIRRRQRLAIELAVRRQRQRVEEEEVRRHHVVGQALHAAISRSSAISGAGGGVGDEVGDEALVAGGVLALDDGDLAHGAGAAASAASISPSSMRKPRILTCWSMRPRYSSSPPCEPAGQVAGAVHARRRRVRRTDRARSAPRSARAG